NIMLEEKVLAIIEEICEDDVIYEERDINLKEEGLMDSLAFVELLVRMEEFGIEVAPTEVTYEEIDTPNKIIHYIETRVNQ
ncbi:D-alanine--poly(phosphoribitol) ligase subunit DltC, partial [Granulicatella sp.]